MAAVPRSADGATRFDLYLKVLGRIPARNPRRIRTENDAGTDMMVI